eukprot:3125716-Rhodomonas_salina.3
MSRRLVCGLASRTLRIQFETLEARVRVAEVLAESGLPLATLLCTACMTAQPIPVVSAQLGALVASCGHVGALRERDHTTDPHEQDVVGLAAKREAVFGEGVRARAADKRLQLGHTHERAHQHVRSLVGRGLNHLPDSLCGFAFALNVKHVRLVRQEAGSPRSRVLARGHQVVDFLDPLLVPLHLAVSIVGALLCVALKQRVVALPANADQVFGRYPLGTHEVHQKLVDGVILVGEHEYRRHSNGRVGLDPERPDDDQRPHNDDPEVRLARAWRTLGQMDRAAERVDQRQQLAAVWRRLLQQGNQLSLQAASQPRVAPNLNQRLQRALSDEVSDQALVVVLDRLGEQRLATDHARRLGREVSNQVEVSSVVEGQAVEAAQRVQDRNELGHEGLAVDDGDAVSTREARHVEIAADVCDRQRHLALLTPI